MSAPLLGEPMPIELANATYAVRGQLQDGLQTEADLAAWLDQVRDQLPLPLPDHVVATPADLATARELRDTIRTLATAAVASMTPDQTTVETLNRHARTSPQWRELSWSQQPSARTHSSAAAVPAALTAIAQATVDLFTGPDLAKIRACHGPGCVLFFIKTHHRREWCSAACGNRARAARHYEHTRR